MRRWGSRNGKSWLDRRRWRSQSRKAKPKQALGPSRRTRASARAPTRARGRGGVPGPRIRKEYWAVCSHCGKEFRAKKLSRMGLGQYVARDAGLPHGGSAARAIRMGACDHHYVCAHCGHTPTRSAHDARVLRSHKRN